MLAPATVPEQPHSLGMPPSKQGRQAQATHAAPGHRRHWAKSQRQRTPARPRARSAGLCSPRHHVPAHGQRRVALGHPAPSPAWRRTPTLRGSSPVSAAPRGCPMAGPKAPAPASAAAGISRHQPRWSQTGRPGIAIPTAQPCQPHGPGWGGTALYLRSPASPTARKGLAPWPYIPGTPASPTP